MIPTLLAGAFVGAVIGLAVSHAYDWHERRQIIRRAGARPQVRRRWWE